MFRVTVASQFPTERLSSKIVELVIIDGAITGIRVYWIWSSEETENETDAAGYTAENATPVVIAKITKIVAIRDIMVLTLWWLVYYNNNYNIGY